VAKHIGCTFGLLFSSIAFLTVGGEARAACSVQECDFPSYRVTARTPDNRTLVFLSDDIGRVEMFDGRGFTHFRIESLWQKTKLKIVYKCAYKNNRAELLETPTFKHEERCPNVADIQSGSIRDINLSLRGTDMDNYELSYRCRIAVSGQESEKGLVGSGQYCGDGPRGPDQTLLIRAEIWLKRN